MNRKYLIAIIAAAVVVVGLIVVIPNLGSADTSTPTTVAGGTAPPISPGATVPEGHPAVEGGGDSTAGADDALKAAEEAYEADPKNVSAGLGLAEAYLQANRVDDSERVLNEVLALEPENSTAKAGLAMVDFARGDAAGAQAALEALTTQAPNDQVALYDLAIVYFSSNERDKAKEAWTKAAAVDPASDLGQLAQQFVTMMDQTAASGSSPHEAGAVTTTTT